MKILKGILIGLLALTIIYLAACFFAPKKLQIEESITINAPAEVIFEEVTDFHTWENWSPWNQMDSNMQSVFSEKTQTVGAWTSWSSDVVGNGRQEIVEAERPNYAKYAMNFGESGDISYAVFEIEEKEDGATEVTWSMDGAELPFYLYPMNFIMKSMIENNYVEGLKNLKSNLESRKEKMSAADNAAGIQLLELEPIPILTIKDSTTAAGINNKLAELYAEITTYITNTEGLEQTNMPLAIYHYYSEDKVILEAGIPYSGEAGENGRIKKK